VGRINTEKKRFFQADKYRISKEGILLILFFYFRLPHACRGIVPPFWDDDGSQFRILLSFHLPSFTVGLAPNALCPACAPCPMRSALCPSPSPHTSNLVPRNPQPASRTPQPVTLPLTPSVSIFQSPFPCPLVSAIQTSYPCPNGDG
jgi:hypothetical protein